MHHSVWEGFKFWVVVSGAVENQVSWLEICFSQLLIWQQVKLVRLIPLGQCVPKFLSEIKDTLTNQGATVDEERCIVEWISWLMVFLGVRDSDVFLGSFDELLPELLFEVRGCSIDLYIFKVLVELELVELFLLEFFEGVLD
jgi:hypothetical protein